MFKNRMFLLLLILAVVFIGLAVLTVAVSHSGDIALAMRGMVPTGHTCESTCWI